MLEASAFAMWMHAHLLLLLVGAAEPLPIVLGNAPELPPGFLPLGVHLSGE
jgi:hypothetical protein